MLKVIIAAAVAGLLAFAAQGPAVAEDSAVVPERIGWTIAPSGNDQDQRVQLTLSYRSRDSNGEWSNSTSLGDLQGLDLAQLRSRDGTACISLMDSSTGAPRRAQVSSP